MLPDANITNPAINQIEHIYTSIPDQYEQYNLTHDATEVTNLAWRGNETPISVSVRPRLEALLAIQRKAKRLTPIVNQGEYEQGEGAGVNSELAGRV
jgi:hypothetical protein